MSETTSLPYMSSSLLTVTKSTASGMMTVAFGAGGNLLSFTPSQLTGLVAWYDASRILGVSSGASLSAWTDLSGQENHLLQTSVVSQPIFVTNAQNGKSAVSSFGTIIGTPRSVMTAPFTLIKPCTIFVAFSVDSKPSRQQNLIDGTAAASVLLGPSIVSTNADFDAFSGSAGVDSLFSVSINSWYAGGAIFTATPSITTVFIGSSLSTGVTSATNPNGISVFGRAAGPLSVSASAKIGEVIVYNRGLSATELSQVTTYLTNGWGTI